ncbi:MAG: alpha/beta hydrolase, partial [Victivallaceae bacterium]|nr:alpha/beta hydrolase [Victivallaceae bacterium]
RDFELEGISCVLVRPNVEAPPNRPWYWRVRFFGAFPDADFARLRQGYHVANIDIGELYGSEEAMRRMDLLYQFLTSRGFALRCPIAGYSRGGLDATRWTLLHPERVSALYLDNAVCDFKSWPGGKGRGPGDADSWLRCLAAWGMSEAEALAFRGNPVDCARELAATHVPVLMLTALADEVVPPEENSLLLARRLTELGAPPTLVEKPGCKHHPHCLRDPEPILDFFRKNR